ncbi:MAG TPA: BTAD domain-containing putative transcriptional regulator [Streptosporangiaceae bacterium]|nr:BTAD domain-containing putative transcriptional regulator [Streptosporangiaceae bacterium]
MVRFRILGPLEFRTGQEWAGIGASKWRSLLAVLLINAGHVVTTDRLIMELWGDEPPAGATNLVSIYALRVRRLIGDKEGQTLRTRPPGYHLVLERDDLDATRFEALVTDGRRALAAEQPERAAELLAEALDLWRDGALVDVPQSPLVAAEAARLEESRLNAIELRIEADIGCGRHAQVIPELSRLIADHPLQEGLRRLLMLALVGAGRRAEALTAYEQARKLIRDELGVAPGEPLQRLYQQILAADSPRRPARAGSSPRTAALAPAPGGGQAPPPAPGPGTTASAAGAFAPGPPPTQLPADITDFTGRERDLDRLCDLPPAEAGEDSPGAVLVSLVTGAGGLGKTTLAVHAAHRMRVRFPDGQLYINLRGASPQPLAPGEVLARFLRDLGVPGNQIPVGEDERAALYRTRLTGRRVLILLDDAADAAQVRPLLPGSASCVVLVTARRWLPDLGASRLIDLDVLDDEDARTLFTSIVGAGRADSDQAATKEVLAACAGLPLAIRIAGARLAARTSWSVRTLASRLASQQRRLDELKAGDLAIRATFEVSFASLPPQVADGVIGAVRAFRLLGLWQGPMIGLPAAAALSGQPDEHVAGALEQLVDVHLLESPAPEIYRLHDLLRVYAAERCQAEEPEEAQQDAVRRILTWYLHTTEAAARIISPNHARVSLSEPGPMIRPLTFDTLEAALDWCDAERANLVAATRQAAASGQHDLAWRLPTTGMSYFYRRGHWADWIATHQIGLDSARKTGDRLGEAWMLNNLGMAHGYRRMTEAVDYFTQALAIYRKIGDQRAEARVMNNLAHSYLLVRRFDEVLEVSGSALAINRQAQHRYGEGVSLGLLGEAYRGLDRPSDAVHHFEQAIVIFRELGDKHAEADSLSDLGEAYLSLGQVEDAVVCLGDSLAIWHTIDDRHGRARTLRLLSHAWQSGGDPEKSRAALTEALALFEELGDDAQAGQVRARLQELGEGSR